MLGMFYSCAFKKWLCLWNGDILLIKLLNFVNILYQLKACLFVVSHCEVGLCTHYLLVPGLSYITQKCRCHDILEGDITSPQWEWPHKQCGWEGETFRGDRLKEDDVHEIFAMYVGEKAVQDNLTSFAYWPMKLLSEAIYYLWNILEPRYDYFTFFGFISNNKTTINIHQH